MDVIVVGSCMTDLVSRVPRLPNAGETIHGSTFTIGFGGKGANQCVIASRLGAKSAMVGKVGSDSFGQNYLQNLKDNNINIDHLGVTSEASTGVAPIAVNDKGENSIVIVAGANLLLSVDDVQRASMLISKSKVLVCQLETRPETSLAALKLARQNGILTILNPAPAVPDLDTAIYKFCDIICPNETEAEVLTGQSVKSLEDASSAAHHFLSLGCSSVVMTLGERGVIYLRADMTEPIHIPATRVTPVDTTGAGDAFVGALAFYLSTMPKLGIEESMRRACAVATISVQASGTQTSYPYRNQLPTALLEEQQ